MIEPEVVRQVREPTERGWGAKKIAPELGGRRNTLGGIYVAAQRRRSKRVQVLGGSARTLRRAKAKP